MQYVYIIDYYSAFNKKGNLDPGYSMDEPQGC
jgi:hypothetical protein